MCAKKSKTKLKMNSTHKAKKQQKKQENKGKYLIGMRVEWRTKNRKMLQLRNVKDLWKKSKEPDQPWSGLSKKKEKRGPREPTLGIPKEDRITEKTYKLASPTDKYLKKK